ncbi:MAG: F0F1 ATP synthase subunit gamma [Gammaproteobacteria bacterium]|nr:F0F1 ATP synthase subunit gamma [Gammaproteobacteria bacterium]
MAGAKDIRNKIKSIQSTQKIMKAMEMVAASKMRRAQERMRASRPYAEKIRNVIRHLASAHPEYRHPYLLEREMKRAACIVISTDRGLCGGLNINLFRATVAAMKTWRDQGTEIELCTIGAKGNVFFRRFGARIVGQASHLGDAPHIEDLIGTVKVVLDAYNEGRIDRVYLVHSLFVNTMTQKPRIAQLVPLQPSKDEQVNHYWDYLYEPDSKEVLDILLQRYIESQVYQGVVENTACEMAARMVAMKSASDNSAQLIEELRLAYNKARQAAITRELSEIVAGAEAV